MTEYMQDALGDIERRALGGAAQMTMDLYGQSDWVIPGPTTLAYPPFTSARFYGVQEDGYFGGSNPQTSTHFEFIPGTGTPPFYGGVTPPRIMIKKPGIYACAFWVEGVGTTADLYGQAARAIDDPQGLAYITESDHGQYYPFDSTRSSGQSSFSRLSIIWTQGTDLSRVAVAPTIVNRHASASRTLKAADATFHIFPLTLGLLPF